MKNGDSRFCAGIGHTGMILLMTAIGILFVINIMVLGDYGAAIRMHADLSPTADSWLVTGKVLVCFVTGILYLVGAYGIFRHEYSLAPAGIAGSILFVGYYVLELAYWGGTYPMVWFGFFTFGAAGILIGIFSWAQGKRRPVAEQGIP